MSHKRLSAPSLHYLDHGHQRSILDQKTSRRIFRKIFWEIFWKSARQTSQQPIT